MANTQAAKTANDQQGTLQPFVLRAESSNGRSYRFDAKLTAAAQRKPGPHDRIHQRRAASLPIGLVRQAITPPTPAKQVTTYQSPRVWLAKPAPTGGKVAALRLLKAI